MKLFFAFFLTIFTFMPIYSQIGINTESPMATLDVAAPSGTNAIAGMQAPRLTLAELTAKGNSLYGAAQRGSIIYISNTAGGDASGQRVNITTSGYYYFDGSVWQKLGSFGDADISIDIVGDIKYSFSIADHAGWYLLNGRSVAGLSPTAKAAAAELGFTANLPDATDRVLKTKSDTESLAASGGANMLTILQANLPNVSFTTAISGTSGSGGAAHTHLLTGTSASGGTAHTHVFNGMSEAGGAAHTHTFNGTSEAGGTAHTHTFSGNSGNMGAHTHTITVPFEQNINHRGNPLSSDISVDSKSTRSTSSSGAHTHTFSGTSGKNTHAHVFSGSSDDNTHTHVFGGFSTNNTHIHTFSGTSSADGAHTHTATGTATVPIGGRGTALDNREPYLAVNAFVYLGL